MKKLFAIFLGLTVVVLLFSSPVLAGPVAGDPMAVPEEINAIESTDAEFDTVPSAEEIATYGYTNYIALNLSPMGFSPLNDGQWSHYYDGWSYRQSGTNNAMAHNVNIPSGAKIEGFTVWVTDTNAAGEVYYVFTRVNLQDNTYSTLGEYNSGYAATPGIYRSYRIFPSAHTVNNDRFTYNILIGATATGTTLKTSGVTFWYRLQMSPAPASASFNDVYPSDWYFQGVEALARSGITGGCGGGSFCPNVAVTRAQMAVFLTRALGLHWPDN